MRFTSHSVPDAIPATIEGLLQAYRQQSLCPEDVLAALWASWQTTPLEQDPAWITRADADFLQAQLDALQGQSPASLPLFGIPFAIKDNIDVEGLPTTAACPGFAYQPRDTAEVVRRLMRAGAIVVGKTNLDQFATGLVGTRSPYGVPTSTFSAEHVSGGSSSGSAVVVARGEVPFALGTDTAGSGRVPAGFNNLVGLKPTPGRVPTHGVLPACRTLDCVSVFSLTTGDAARVLSVIDGPMPGEPVFQSHPLQTSSWAQPLRIGVPMSPEFFGDTDYEQAFARALALWSEVPGAASDAVSLVPVDLTPFNEVARLLYEGPWVAERYAAIAELMEREPEAVHPVVRGIIAQAHRYDAVGTFQAHYRLQELAAQLLPTWDQIDVLMVPTAPTHPTLQQVAADPVGANARLGTYTNFVNLLGLAALALPAGRTAAGLPFGITLIAPGGRDAALLALGERWQSTVQARLYALAGHELAVSSHHDQAGVEVRSAPEVALAVVGAHLEGMPLHHQLQARQARLLSRTHTAPRYRLVALPDSVPPKPGLARVTDESAGRAIEVEVYAMPEAHVGSFLSLIPPPLGLGTLELADGTWVKGFICEPCGLAGAEDISHHGGWRAYCQHRIAAQEATP